MSIGESWGKRVGWFLNGSLYERSSNRDAPIFINGMRSKAIRHGDAFPRITANHARLSTGCVSLQHRPLTDSGMSCCGFNPQQPFS